MLTLLLILVALCVGYFFGGLTATARREVGGILKALGLSLAGFLFTIYLPYVVGTWVGGEKVGTVVAVLSYFVWAAGLWYGECRPRPWSPPDYHREWSAAEDALVEADKETSLPD